MVMPLAGRAVAAVIGGLLVVGSVSSVTGTLIVSRSVSSRLTRWVDRLIDMAYQMAAGRAGGYHRRDRLLATQAAAILLTQLAAWLIVAYVGFALLLWPFAPRGLVSAFTDAGSSLFTLGFAVPAGSVPAVIVFMAAAIGLVIVTLQIAYLPTLYAAFNRRETDVALLNARGGFPAWGPELLARTHYALGSGMSTLDTMPELYTQWERWAADVGESHTTYLQLVRFRSPQPLSSWVTSLLSVVDSAALFLALSPKAAPTIPARLCLRSGFLCFTRIAQAMGFDVPNEPDPAAEITLTYDEFLAAVARLREVDFPIEREPADAWPDFVGWRLNYERPAYLVASAVYAVPALWSGPRRHPIPPIPPIRPGRGRAPKLRRRDAELVGQSGLRREHAERTLAGPVAHLEEKPVRGHDPQSRAVRGPAHADDVAGPGRERAQDRGQRGDGYRAARDPDQLARAQVRDVDGRAGDRALRVGGVKRKAEAPARRVEVGRVTGIDDGARRQGELRVRTAAHVGDVQEAIGRAVRGLPGHVVRVGACDDRARGDAGRPGAAVRRVHQR
jgi:hypothetical protein